MKWKIQSLLAALLLILVCSPIFAQEAVEKKEVKKVYMVPIGDNNHKIELVLANSTGKQLKKILVKIENKPSWMNIENEEVEIAKIAARKEVPASFSFKITGKATVGDTAEVNITASNSDGFSWEKTIKLNPGAPLEFELMPNYPNPFNPATTIRYRLPVQMDVQVTVYNILGRKVATLAEGLQKAGQQELRWDASNMASGLYFYRVIAENSGGKRIIENQKMMLIK